MGDGCSGYDRHENDLGIGARARVKKGGDRNRLRYRPAIEGKNIVGAIPPGGEMRIIAGPVCANDVIWWAVSTNDAETTDRKNRLGKDVVGWTAEWQKGGGYYIERI